MESILIINQLQYKLNQDIKQIMALAQQLLAAFHNKILNQQYDQIDLTDSNVIKQLCLFVQQLQPLKSNIQIIKNLMRAYGLPIIIFTKKFYEKSALNSQFVQENISKLKKLATIAQQQSLNQQIYQINFIYKFGSSNKKPKIIQKQEIDIKFIHYVKQIGLKNKQLQLKIKNGNKKISIKQYKQYLSKVKDQQNQFDLLMLKSLQKFKISLQELQQLEKQQIKSNLIKDYDFKQQQQQSKSYLDESMSADFYNVVPINETQSYKFYTSDVSQIGQKTQFQSCNYMTFLQNMPQKNQSLQFSQKSNKNKNQYKTPVKLKKSSTQSQQLNYLCCRTSFFKEQIIKENQNQTITFMYAPYPFRDHKIFDIRDIICSFLNHNGGILFIGIVKQFNNFVIVGSQICQGQKQNVLRTFRQICQKIQPDILTNKIYNVEFVPIRFRQGQKFVKGLYVIKVTVKYGNRDQIYSFRENGYDNFPFRQNGKIVHKQGREVLMQLNKRIAKPLPIPVPLHSYPCLKPQIGQQLNRVYYDTAFNKKKNQNNQNHLWHTDGGVQYKAKQVYQSHRANQSPPKKIIQNIKSPEHPKISPFQIQIHYEKQKHQNFKKSQLVPQKIQIKQQIVEKEVKQVTWVYFYLIGLLKKQLIPVLVKKGIYQKLNIQQSDESLVVKASDKQVVKQIRKIFKKLQQKYQQTYSIKYYELSLQLEVQNLGKSINQLKNLNLKYKVKSQNLIKFTYYKDSLKAFLELSKKGLQVQFYSVKKD